jgi:dipeptidyl aminopeptidase/acylaminoacyl peptidase
MDCCRKGRLTFSLRTASRTRIVRRSATIVSICFAWHLLAQQVEVRNGDIYYHAQDGVVRQVTSKRADTDASLSPDGRFIIFIRRTSELAGFEEPKNVNPVRTQVWLVRVDGTAPPYLVFGDVVPAWKFRYVTFSCPQLSPDNRYAYFLIMLSATDNAIVRVDISTGHAEVISNAILYYLIARGRYAGDLVVQKRKEHPQGVDQSFWLVSPQGKELGFVGSSENEAQGFLENPDRKLQPH